MPSFYCCWAAWMLPTCRALQRSQASWRVPPVVCGAVSCLHLDALFVASATSAPLKGGDSLPCCRHHGCG